jgi:hypothetical protein
MSFATKDIKKLKNLPARRGTGRRCGARAGDQGGCWGTDRTKNKSYDLLGYFKKSYSGCYQCYCCHCASAKAQGASYRPPKVSLAPKSVTTRYLLVKVRVTHTIVQSRV